MPIAGFNPLRWRICRVQTPIKPPSVKVWLASKPVSTFVWQARAQRGGAMKPRSFPMAQQVMILPDPDDPPHPRSRNR